MHILLTVLHTFLTDLVRRICLNIKTSHPWWSLSLFSSLECLTLFRPGFFRPSGTGASEAPPPPPTRLCIFKTSYAMATKFAQDRVRTNSNPYRYCDVTVTCMASSWHHLFLNVSLRSSKAINLLNTVPEGVKIFFLV